MSIETMAMILLGGRVISTGFTINVIRRQWVLKKFSVKHMEAKARILGRPRTLTLETFRAVLLMLSLVVLASNVAPIIIDIATQFVDTGRPQTIRLVSVAYSLSSNLHSLLSSIIIWILYKMAELLLENNQTGE